ncbi:selenocysteine-specific translation elongation factor [Ectothiorhodospira shaposhnikovii]|uniref:selenocysteine-specific translation elongation factor n=1 Tax=Ectothiorhodospira shaposhnikovii TaxID=1054 RepID=UPI001EE7C308|nr:selenocysteine-specific translation elongation factor [Ectothiorhodospira shaposhnikovii]MCG5514222.1 selenocysteine-specific translation elongation factor [Ectothiorhodospira shaposhnikovii]
MIIGTAGHIDHGKTALVKALTGVDADRWKEEQARGITLDLGYAYQTLDDGLSLGFVDVPGHERLIHNMLAGATGIDHVLLVIAADDGPMPQTLEHLQILSLLGLERGTVALNKCDRVDEDRLARVLSRVQALLRDSALADAPVLPVSAITGRGLAALKDHLHRQARLQGERRHEGRFRLAVDRCFTLGGTGTVVTGTVHAGQVRVGDHLCLSPSGLNVRVRGLHAQNRPAERGLTGQRCALNLTGPHLTREAVSRGDWVVDPDLHHPAVRLDARLRVLADAPGPLTHWTPVHLHLGAARLMARVAVLEGEAIPPGADGLVQLVLSQETHALRGDRFVLRDVSARRNLGGGLILDPWGPARGRRTASRLALLRAWEQNDPLAALRQALPQAPGGLNLETLSRQWNLDPTEQTRLADTPDLLTLETPAGPVAFDPGLWQDLKTRTLKQLGEEHAHHPDRLGPDRERLRRRVAPALARPVFAALVDELLAAGAVRQQAPWLHLPDHCLHLSPDQETLWQNQILPLVQADPFNPPRVRDIARALSQDETHIRALMQQLTAMGQVCRIAHDHYFHREAVAELEAIVRELSDTEGAALAAPFRDRIGTGRKVAIQILEYFDRIGYCRRVGDEHRVFRDSLWRMR